MLSAEIKYKSYTCVRIHTNFEKKSPNPKRLSGYWELEFPNHPRAGHQDSPPLARKSPAMRDLDDNSRTNERVFRQPLKLHPPEKLLPIQLFQGSSCLGEETSPN
ncbi:MAG: hypothetical protein AMJ73_08445 [candidate division Zixibacteria bacterium SM1_73]|nr:MAG: hypothetical protein AMJ73_08445 [candidate division Zixibacteria bacterium SM1_73]